MNSAAHPRLPKGRRFNMRPEVYPEVVEKMPEFESKWVCPHFARPSAAGCSTPSTEEVTRRHISLSHPRETRGPVPAVAANPPWAS